MYSTAIKQPKKALSFLSRVLTIRNSEVNLNKSHHFSQQTKTQAENFQAPPHPRQSDLVSKLNKLDPEARAKLKVAMEDYKKDPEMAKEKWGLLKSPPAEQAVRAEIKRSSSSPQPNTQAKKLQAPLHSPLSALESKLNTLSPETRAKLKMAMEDLKKDPEMAKEKWGLLKSPPAEQAVRTEIKRSSSSPQTNTQAKKLQAPLHPPLSALESKLNTLSPETRAKLKMAMEDLKKDPEMAKEKWGLLQSPPAEQAVRAEIKRSSSSR